MTENNNESNLWHVEAICEKLPFTKPEPLKPDEYADHLSGDWKDVPAWAIRRINFLEKTMEFYERSRCPQMEKDCPDCPDMSCHAVKHCYPYLCKGSCGHNEIWVSAAPTPEDVRRCEG